jgi:hypothetical protein
MAKEIESIFLLCIVAALILSCLNEVKSIEYYEKHTYERMVRLRDYYADPSKYIFDIDMKNAISAEQNVEAAKSFGSDYTDPFGYSNTNINDRDNTQYRMLDNSRGSQRKMMQDLENAK